VQDTHLKFKTAAVAGSSLTIKQHVPGGLWALVPNPGERDESVPSALSDPLFL
jgi:hypothetical protein